MLKNSGWVPTYFSNSSDAKFYLVTEFYAQKYLARQLASFSACEATFMATDGETLSQLLWHNPSINNPSSLDTRFVDVQGILRRSLLKSVSISRVFLFTYFYLFFYFFAKAQHKPISMSLWIVRFCCVRLADLLTEQLSNHAYAQQGCAQNARSQKLL